jgi:hypothetical protein
MLSNSSMDILLEKGRPTVWAGRSTCATTVQLSINGRLESVNATYCRICTLLDDDITKSYMAFGPCFTEKSQTQLLAHNTVRSVRPNQPIECGAFFQLLPIWANFDDVSDNVSRKLLEAAQLGTKLNGTGEFLQMIPKDLFVAILTDVVRIGLE